MNALKQVGYLSLLSFALGLVSCQTYDPVSGQTQFMGPGEAIGRGLDSAVMNVGWAARTGATNATTNLGTATRNVGWAARSGATNAADATRRLGQNVFGPWQTYPGYRTTAPSGLTPVRGNTWGQARLTRSQAYSQGYENGFQDAQRGGSADPGGSAAAATATNQRAYYNGYVQGWNAIAVLN